MDKAEIESWFSGKARELSKNRLGTNATILSIVHEYNNKYQINNLQNEREFNPIFFSYLFTKVRTIGFSTKTVSNDDFIQYRNLLIIELNYYSKAIAVDFAQLLSNKSLQSYSKDFIILFI